MNSIAIIMGNDGAASAPLSSASGSRIWVQTPASRANSAMSDPVAGPGCAELASTPGQLVQRPVRWVEDAGLLARRVPGHCLKTTSFRERV